ncbi:MAG: hypothetical protein QXL19_09275 [Ignisphaera sp.]
MFSRNDMCITLVSKLLVLYYNKELKEKEIDISSYIKECGCSLTIIRAFLNYINYTINLKVEIDNKIIPIDISDISSVIFNTKDISEIKIGFCRGLEKDQKSFQTQYEQYVYYPIIKIGNSVILLTDRKFYFKNFTKFKPCNDIKSVEDNDLFENTKLVGVFLVKVNISNS